MNEDDLITWFRDLSMTRQRQVLTKLGRVTKKPPASIRFPRSDNMLTKVSRLLNYCTKHKIEFTPKNVKGNVIVTFRDLETRNEVLIGMNT